MRLFWVGATLCCARGSDDCAQWRDHCSACWAEGCRLCEVGPVPWTQGDTAESQRAAQGQYLDVVCADVSDCRQLTTLRPSTEYVHTIESNECSDYVYPPTANTDVPTASPTQPPVDMEIVETTADSTMPWQLLDWGPGQWILATLPAAVLCATGCCGVLYHHRRQAWLKKRRVHVASTHSQSMFGGAALWDFSQVGPLAQQDVEDAEMKVKELRKEGAFREARLCLSFGEGNQLRAKHLKVLDDILHRHPELTLSFHADWRDCGDREIERLAELLAKKGRCTVRAVAVEVAKGLQAAQADEIARHVAGGPLRMPASADLESAHLLGAALSVGGHGEVDTLTFEVNLPDTPPHLVPLTDLRFGFKNLELARCNLGDVGAAAVCGFVEPWADRLKVIKMVDCKLGDAGAEFIANLLKQAAVGETVRQICLSGNRLGDVAASALASALPTCDSLDRLLLDRNCIGANGARALAKKLPRSAVRELVLGSDGGGNPLGGEGAKAFADALNDDRARAESDRENRLGSLSLDDCNIGLSGARALADALPFSALSTLSLARNGMLEEGAEAILEKLPACMTSLDLAGNQLSDRVASKVGQLLWRNRYIAVSVAQNPVSPMLRELLIDEHGQRLRI